MGDAKGGGGSGSGVALLVGTALGAAAGFACATLAGRAERAPGPAAPRAAGGLRGAVEAASRGSYVLRNVRVPVATLADGAEGADAEGLVVCDVSVEAGSVKAVSEAGAGSGGTVVDAQGALLWPAFVDAHTHLVKTNTVPRCRNPSGSINDALACEVSDVPRWKGGDSDVARRMDFALRCAWHHGTRAVRTHLDGTNQDDPSVQASVWKAFDAAQKTWGERGLVVQGVANLYLPLWCKPGLAGPFAAEAKRHKGVVLGAYCGDVSESPQADTIAGFKALFRYAQQEGLDVDLHIDETNNPMCCGLEPLCVSLQAARTNGFKGHVVLGHATSLSLQSDAHKESVMARLAKLDVTVVCNPPTNLGLMDRRGTEPPIGALVARDVPRTPTWRGLTNVQELRAKGVRVCAASDNVRDWWHPFGDYDCLAVWHLAVSVGHLDTAPCEGSWADLVTTAPAAAMKLPVGGVIAGATADLVLFPSARRVSELLARPQTDRVVLRKGVPQQSSLPQYSELDDLVKELSPGPAAMGTVLRGATKAS